MLRHPRLLFAAILILSACLHASAQSQPQPQSSLPAPAPTQTGLDALSAYQGTWKFTSTTLDTPHSKSSHDEKILRNDCWRSSSYFACNQFLDGKSQDLIVFTYHEDKNLYTTYIVPLDGSAAS